MDPYLNQVWTTWNQVTQTLTVNSALNTTQLQQVWTNWVGQAATTSNIATINHQIQQIAMANQGQVWTNWCRDAIRQQGQSSTAIRRDVSATPHAPAPDYHRVEQERRQAEQEAKNKAEILLLKHLSEKQREDLKQKGYFLVEVAGEIYKIMRGFAGNIKLLDKAGRDAKSFCIHPRERVPDADAMLAQKLLLEADTERFHKIANVTELQPVNDNRRAA